jgi:hypothetical protein
VRTNFALLFTPGETKALAKSKVVAWYTNFALLFTTGETKALAKSKVVGWYMIARSVIRKNSILKDRYLENCFIYKNFKAIFVCRNKKNLFIMGNCEI